MKDLHTEERLEEIRKLQFKQRYEYESWRGAAQSFNTVIERALCAFACVVEQECLPELGGHPSDPSVSGAEQEAFMAQLHEFCNELEKGILEKTLVDEVPMGRFEEE